MSKRSLMEAVADEVKACRKCGLWKGRKNAVLGEGNLDVTVMFIGEAPGYWEDVKSRPFVGAAGKILGEMLSRVGFSRGEVYITNVVKCSLRKTVTLYRAKSKPALSIWTDKSK